MLVGKAGLSIFYNTDFTPLQAARETGALKEAKDKLEKQLEELTWRLQLEKRLRVGYVGEGNTPLKIFICLQHFWLVWFVCFMACI